MKIEEAQLEQLRANQRFLVRELLRRGVSVRLVDRNYELLEASFGDHKELLLDIDSSLVPYSTSIVSGNKHLTKLVLEAAGISIPRGKEFFRNQKEYALEYALELGLPVVAKPSLGVAGDQVHLNLEHLPEVEAAIDQIIYHRGEAGYVIEEFFDASEYRVFITRDGQYAVLYREPAYVIGDGEHNLIELARIESERRMNPRKNSLGPILMDEIAEKFLRKNGRTFQHVPAPGEKVQVRPNSNIGTGGVSEDYTDKAHPSVLEIAARALAAFPGMPYAGLDLMTNDITISQTSESYRIIEVNSLPGIGMHLAPGRGAPRDVARMLADMVFPETRQLVEKAA